MTTDAFSRAMCELDERYIAEALDCPGTAPPIRLRRRLPIALAAALLSLFLLGAGAVAGLFGDSIQSWFEYHWERMTGQTMSEAHGAVIEHLSQEIGVCQTVGETTVTADSATVGDDILYLLLRVEGPSLSRRHSYSFEHFGMELSPDPLEGTGGMGGIGLQFYDLDGDGAALFLMEFEYGSHEGFTADTGPLEVLVELEDLLRTGKKDRLLEEGKWTLRFTLDRSRLPEPIPLPDTEVTALNTENEPGTVLYSDIELTSTGIRFRHDLAWRGDHLALVEAPEHIRETMGVRLVPQMYLLLKNGTILESGGGLGVAMHDIGKLACSYHWRIPVNLDEVAAVQIGQTQIPIP